MLAALLLAQQLTQGSGVTSKIEQMESRQPLQQQAALNPPALPSTTTTSEEATNPPADLAEPEPKIEAALSIRPTQNPIPSAQPKSSRRSQRVTSQSDQKAAKPVGVAKVKVNIIPTDMRFSVDGGPKQGVPWQGDIEAGSHNLTFFCVFADYKQSISVTLSAGSSETIVWDCTKRQRYRPPQ